jgi:pantothenate kinase
MTIQIFSLEAAVERAITLTQNAESRVIIGLVGKPGSGKSTLSTHLMKKLPKETTALVPMDGFHLSNAQLAWLGRSERKGAPDTFDSDGYANLIERIKIGSDEEIHFPIFHRELDESISDEGIVPPNTTLVLTEGNYLLLEEGGWSKIPNLLTESWFIDVNNDRRMARLVSRHIKYGKSPEAAHEWANGPDQRNADLIEATRMKADAIVHLD